VTIQPSSDSPSDHPRRGASRPTIVLGLACIGGFVGLVAGGFIGFHALGMELPDHADLLPFCMLVGAGAGWLSGAALGSVVGRDARSPGTTGRRLVLVGSVVVVIGAFVIASLPVRSGWPEGGVTFFSFWRRSGGAVAGIAVVVDAAIALATLWSVGRNRPGDGSGLPGPFAGATGIAGLCLGGLTFVFAMWFAAANWSSTVEHQKYRVVYATTTSLANAASRRLDRTGSFPTNLDEVLAAGGRIQPGALVEFAGVVHGSFCARVGVDDGEDRLGDPRYAALVHRRPKGSHSWTSSEIGQGNSCMSRGSS
jgi:hypothetical protein